LGEFADIKAGNMKKTAKVGKRAVSRAKTTQKTGKKAVKPTKTPRKRRKIANSDPIKAVLLAGALIAVSALISMVVILTRNTGHETEIVSSATAEPETQKPVSVKPSPAETSTTPAARNNTATTSTTPTETNAAPSTRTTPSASSTTPVTRTTPSATNATPVTRNNPATNTTPVTRTTPTAANATPAARTTTNAPEKPPANLGTLVFVIDDAGNNLRELEPFLRISGPLTIAVLPGLPNSAEAARRIRQAGKEVFLHQPMEAIGAQNPGPGAIYCGMSDAEIRAVLARNIAEVGPVAGMNNHQGSKVTMDREAMKTILSFCAENNLLFLDSRTTAETVATDVARQIGMKIGERNIFLDNEQDKGSMLRYIESGLARAQKNGSAVMIGHTWSPGLAPLLAEQFPALVKQGYVIKRASDVIR